MCQSDPNQLQTLARLAAAGTDAVVAGVQAGFEVAKGSRRRRIWELDGHAQCPVLGACLPIRALRKLVNKVLGGQAVADDYELHSGAVADCKYRSKVAEAVQRELDRRYALTLHRTAKLKTTEELAVLWEDALACQDIAGALWAVLTHARCTPALALRIEGQVHMLQHQVGVATRADLDRLDALHEENGVLGRELAAAQQRTTRMAEDHARRQEALQGQVMRERPATPS